MIVEVTVRVVTDDGEQVIAVAGSHERVVQVNDLERNVLATQAKITELSDLSRDAAVRQIAEEAAAVKDTPAPAEGSGRSRPMGRRP